MRKHRLQRHLLAAPILLVTALLLAACTPASEVVVGEVVERETGNAIENATITMALLDDEGQEVETKSCQDCQTLSQRIDWFTRGDTVIIRVEAPGYVPWQTDSSSDQAPPTAAGGGYRVELTPLSGLEAYRAELAAAAEKVEGLLSEAQRRHFPPEAFEQSLIEALAGLHQVDENLGGLVPPTPTPAESGD